MHEGSKRHLPSGIRSLSDTRYPSSSWLVATLPYLEATTLWDRAVSDYEAGLNPFISHSGMRKPNDLFNCPSSPRKAGPHWTHENLLVATTDFVGVNGRDNNLEDGVLFANSRIKFAAIIDGLSNTLMVGERPPSPDYWYGWWYAGTGFDGSGSPDMVLGVSELNDGNSNGRITYLEECDLGPYAFSKGQADEQCSALHFWSGHSAGAFFAHCDGAVKLYSYDIDQFLLEGLASRRGGEVVTD